MILFILDKINIAIKTPAALLQIYYCCKITRIISFGLQNTNLSVTIYLNFLDNVCSIGICYLMLDVRPSYI